ncbi:MAG: ATP-binding protein [Thermoanaerobacteraceae bacterium]|nr:ATP-binding protein [Thermoanaerobacteraceae bacterium]
MNSPLAKILTQYEKKRDKAFKEFLSRKENIYKKLPRIREIDEEISSIGLEKINEAFHLPEKCDDILDELKTVLMRLKQEKEAILKSQGLPLDYLRIHYECEDCQDTGYINGSMCHCLKQNLIGALYDLSHLKNILKYENFENFDLSLYSDLPFGDYPRSPRKNMENIYLECIKFSNNFPDVNESLFFYGNSGLGKTFLSHCIAKDLIDKGHTVIYQTVPNLIEILRKTALGEANEEAELINECDFLILDDLGTESATAYSEQVIFNIINTRLLSGKKMLISTNFNLEELMNTYPERICSRIFGNFRIYAFYGDDIRLKKVKVI